MTPRHHNRRIQVFDTTGHYLAVIGSNNLSLPVAIDKDTNDCTWGADAGNHALHGFDPAGGHYLTIKGPDTITPLAVAVTTDNGYLYTIDLKHRQLSKYLVLYTDTSRMHGNQSGTPSGLVPRELTLLQSYPNPAIGHLTIRYGVPRTTKLSLKVCDISGKLTRTLANHQTTRPGFYNVTWDCKDHHQRRVGNGVYFYRLTTGNEPTAHENRVRKLVIAR